MKKIKLWIKEKLKNYLGMISLEEDFEFYKKLHDFETDRDRKYALKVESKTNDAIRALHTTLESVVSIATDVQPFERSGSWAVVCVEGRVNRVQFYALGSRDAQEVFSFLKSFEAGRHCIDSPMKFFKDGLFKFE